LAITLSETEMVRIRNHSPLPEPLPDETNEVERDARAVRFGKALFFDCRLSQDQTTACASCHQPEMGWGDGLALNAERHLLRHVPTLLNAAYARWLFWDGRSDSLWSQALEPLEAPLEHGGTRLAYAHLLHDRLELRAQYKDLFGSLPELSDKTRFPETGRPIPGDTEHPDNRRWQSMAAADRHAVDVVFSNIGKAIAAFVKTIRSGPSRFDEFARGLAERDTEQLGALTAPEQRGLKLFFGRGNCWLCHGGPSFSDGEFHQIGLRQTAGAPEPARYDGIQALLANPFNGAGAYSGAVDSRRARELMFLKPQPEDFGNYKTPTLRDVAHTAPYMHQGHFASLNDVAHYYSTFDGAVPRDHHQETFLWPLQLTASEEQDLVDFLGSLTTIESPAADYPKLTCP
jgi:cytochrome c peroxidase